MSMSMIGLAARPGTAVDPTWSMRTATSSTAGQTRVATVSNHCGQSGS